jgi:hypothetical protein
VVEALAERWGGTVQLGDRADGGTRAEVRLPLAGSPTPDPDFADSLPKAD